MAICLLQSITNAPPDWEIVAATIRDSRGVHRTPVILHTSMRGSPPAPPAQFALTQQGNQQVYDLYVHTYVT